ncbi:MAG TPA: class C sortase, partial [Bifidobacterium sp.]|nr:class C sortase [Bifidobacterium sp.]
RILPGQDRLTLMTCTPYGINSHRLLVSGRRVGIPVPAPDPTDLHDGRTVGGWSALSVTLCGCAGVVAYRKPWRSPGECMRHATRMYGKGAASRRKHAA